MEERTDKYRGTKGSDKPARSRMTDFHTVS